MKLRIFYSNQQTAVPVTPELKKLIRLAAKNTLRFEDYNTPCELSVTFTDDSGIRKLNSAYRGKDAPTDVLSFPMLEGENGDCGRDGEYLVLGDVVLSLERSAAQGELYGHGFDRETAFLVIHSVLHLLGYDHETGEAEELDMRARQTAIAVMCGLGISDAEIKGKKEEE